LYQCACCTMNMQHSTANVSAIGCLGYYTILHWDTTDIA
jgi:hypothetical protein